MSSQRAEPFLDDRGRPMVLDGTPVLVSRSARRRRTVSARRDPQGIVVLLPARMSRRDELQWVEKMARRVLDSQERRRPPQGDDELMRRAADLARRHLEPVVGAPVRPASVRWVTNQNQRWGSCSLDTRAIRLSHRLREMPDWVVDHVLVHELVHLVEANHTARFHALVARYPQAERAKGFLEGWLAAQHLPPVSEQDEDEVD